MIFFVSFQCHWWDAPSHGGVQAVEWFALSSMVSGGANRICVRGDHEWLVWPYHVRPVVRIGTYLYLPTYLPIPTGTGTVPR